MGDAPAGSSAPPSPGFLEALLGPAAFETRVGRWWLALSSSVRVAVLSVVLGSAIFLPYLGAVGLWDCWETHYGEVARSMIQRSDYVYPYWENAWFFSKPALTMWLMALGMHAVGTNRTEGALASLTEWGMRLPFALLSILALALLALAVARVVNRRAGLATAVVLSTMPMYFLLTRQAVTDTPFVSTLVCAMACALIGQLDSKTRHRAAWWYGFYFFCGLSALAKGLLGPGIPGVLLLVYAALCVLPWTAEAWKAHGQWLISGAVREQVRAGARPMPALWGQMYRMKLGTGLLVFLAVAGPWYAVMFSFDGVDDEGSSFWLRFKFDHFGRMFEGVHTTTPGGNFTYFIEQAGFGLFPWVALVPGAFAVASRLRLRSSEPRQHLGVIAVVWVAFTFYLLSSSATKFHHYVFPILPGVALLIALFVDALWEEGPAAHAMSLLLGLVLFALIGKDLGAQPKYLTDLYVYNYERAYPTELTQTAIASLHRLTTATLADELLGILLLSTAGYILLEALVPKPGPFLPARRTLGFAVAVGAVALFFHSRGSLPALGIGVAVLLVVLYVAGRLKYLESSEGRLTVGALAAVAALVGLAYLVVGVPAPFLEPLASWLESIQGGRNPFRASGLGSLTTRQVLSSAIGIVALICVAAAVAKERVVLFGSFLFFALGFALWTSWKHWVDLSPHWSQRDLFQIYHQERQPGEPIAAYLMNWRGETLYSKNRVKQIKDNARMLQFAQQPGAAFALVEHHRLHLLRNAVGAGQAVTPLTDKVLNNKFTLVRIAEAESDLPAAQ